MKAKRLSAIFLTASLVLMTFLNVAIVTAQFGDGSLRGTVTDEQGLALPGVTVSASSEDLITPRTAVTDEKGEFRIANLPPGMYTLTGELEGFAVYRQDGIYLRAGANFLVDMTLTIGGMSETLTVTAESPMLEVTNPGNVLNLDGEFQRELPISEGNYWSDFLQMTPGVLSRPHNDGSGRQNYFGNAVDHRDAVLLMEGFVASNYNDSNINRTALSTAAIEDTQLKLGGVDAAAPMGYGLVVNVVSKSGGDSFSGSADWTYQPFSWNGDNTGGEGIPATRSVNQADFSFGGPIVREKAWFFAAARWQANGSSSSRTPEQAATLRAVFNTQELDDNTFDGFQPWVKVTSQLSSRNTLSAVYQNDRLHLNTAEQIAARRLEVLSTGGSTRRRSRSSPRSRGRRRTPAARAAGGAFKHRAHKGYWSQDSGYYYTASGEPGFRNTLLHIWDLRDPANPKFVGRAWLPGMKDSEDESLYEGQYVHHPILDEANDRLYIGFRGSGWTGAWDISDKADPKLVWSYDTSPPGRGPHTITPIVYDEVPNFG